MSRIYPSPVSGLTDFPRMCRRRSASIPVVAYVVDIGPRYRSLIIPRFSFFTRVPSCIQNDSIRGCSTGRLIGKIIARGKRRGIISEGYIRKLFPICAQFHSAEIISLEHFRIHAESTRSHFTIRDRTRHSHVPRKKIRFPRKYVCTYFPLRARWQQEKGRYDEFLGEGRKTRDYAQRGQVYPPPFYHEPIENFITKRLLKVHRNPIHIHGPIPLTFPFGRIERGRGTMKKYDNRERERDYSARDNWFPKIKQISLNGTGRVSGALVQISGRQMLVEPCRAPVFPRTYERAYTHTYIYICTRPLPLHK